MPATNYANLIDQSISLTASGAVIKERFIEASGAQCGLGEKSLGVSAYAAATTEDVTAYTGVIRILAGGTIAQSAYVMSDANGKAITYAAGGSGTDYKKNGIAVSAGTDGNIMLVYTSI